MHWNIQRVLLGVIVLSFLSHFLIITIHHPPDEAQLPPHPSASASSASPSSSAPPQSEHGHTLRGPGDDNNETSRRGGGGQDIAGDKEWGVRRERGRGKNDVDVLKNSRGVGKGKRGRGGGKGQVREAAGETLKLKGEAGRSKARSERSAAGWQGSVTSRDHRNPVVILLSEGRSGSTVTGSVLLEHHPHCTMYLDELVWLVFRQHLASSEDQDRDVAIDMFLNSTQCALHPRVWADTDTVGGWFSKRSTYANQERAKGVDYFTIEKQQALCRSVGEAVSSGSKASVCAKEIRFQGFVRELIQAASSRGIPLSVIYMLRDPRATAFSQMWVFPTQRLKQRDLSRQSSDLLKAVCAVARRDLDALRDAPPGVTVVEFCFEDLLSNPLDAVEQIYRQTPGLLWEGGGPGGGKMPDQVNDFARLHLSGWPGAQENEANSTGGLRGKEGRGGGVDHRYSAEISRSKHVEKWKETWQYIRYETMRRTWAENEDCKALRKLSKCSKAWPEIAFNRTFVAEAYKARFGVSISDKELDVMLQQTVASADRFQPVEASVGKQQRS